jgi:hypothetical protein
VLLESVEDIEALLISSRLISREPVWLALDMFDSQERRRWEAKLNSLRHECGCSMGAKFAIVALAFAVIRFVFTPPNTFLGLLVDISVTVLAFAVAGLIGKFAGICLARLQFRHCCHQLLKQLI